MVNYPNALQSPPSGYTLPDRFMPLTQPTGGSGSGSSTNTGNAPIGATARTNGTANGTSSTSSPLTSSPSPSVLTQGTTPSPDVSAVDTSLPSNNTNTLLVDPNSQGSHSNIPESGSMPTNVGDHVLNSQGEVDGSAIGLGRLDQNGNPVNDSDNQGLSPGAKAGAIAGTLVTFFILIAIAFMAKRIHRGKANKIDRRHSTMIERQRSSSLTENESDYVIHPH
ncbi:hypothetical protein MJO28_017113 [Puccinia striiformis f. sp. tritici]|uniref:Uncharacterized protein n=2 Tax=Puccinia striiformis TaxID=27350 RepID=A0A2S4UIZ0_9BASI|nr:hypothetical protein Pst134EA_005587 [Puccinia striiformis f. sp. tritici]KAI9628669.1 hypothetical protein KEM48_011455 [Puccinia striiformis f. sp. tritici PST-130]POV97288.1 hypothetical protein PSTT_15144 [Puccinia striiformis]KAH9462781.1 hypothetical protein Pst134EB_006656 [Puccinia striiformis f. sp. tritici]KAH9471708.1 hypothetical protein Pst134EA_005587 [Puccinia striiformis f. sp. tritici]KAI7934396.1 hypothetical protein MJO28_017113 [Puccinia striiformis f. sp. tritici]